MIASPRGYVSDHCGTIFKDPGYGECFDELQGRAARSGLLFTGAMGLTVPGAVTLVTARRDDKMPFWISFLLVGLPTALVSFLGFGLFWLIRFPGGD
jgi:hypothetical protein